MADPDSPNNGDHHVTFQVLHGVLRSDAVLPKWVLWRSKVTNRVSVTLQEGDNRGADMRVIISVKLYSRNVVEHAEEDDPANEENCEQLYVPQTFSD